jgi:hypothetical protein
MFIQRAGDDFPQTGHDGERGDLIGLEPMTKRLPAYPANR